MKEGRDNGFEFGSDGLIALSLGSDSYAEHETGIASILGAFGVPQDEKVFGRPRRVITKCPDGLMWSEGRGKNSEDKTVKICGFHMGYYGEAWIPSAIRSENGLYTAWDQKNFCAYSCDERNIRRLRELYDAFEVRNVAIWMGGGHVFKNPGLVLAIATRLPSAVIMKWQKLDELNYRTKEEMRASGIEEKLAKAGKRYFALSPKKNDEGKLIFWLNPMEQNIHEAGWFTLSDLEEWAENKGKVMKSRSRSGSDQKR